MISLFMLKVPYPISLSISHSINLPLFRS